MKKFVSLTLTLLIFVLTLPCGAAEANSLGSPSEWAAEDIGWATQHGIGTEGITNAYKENITRAEFAALMVPIVEEMGGEIEPAPAGTFNDTDSVYVLKAASAGIVNGAGDGSFNPDALITRQEIAVMICRAVGYVESRIALYIIGAHPELMGDHTADIADYNDYDEVADLAKKEVALLNVKGVMVGTGAKTISPLSNASVQEAIILASRVAKDVFRIS